VSWLRVHRSQLFSHVIRVVDPLTHGRSNHYRFEGIQHVSNPSHPSQCDGAVSELMANAFRCDVSDALLKLQDPQHPHGGFLADLILWSPKRQEGLTKVVGPAYTVKYVSHKDENKPTRQPGHYVCSPVYWRLSGVLATKAHHFQIDSIPPGAVVFISAPPNIVNAVYGGLMSHRAKVVGAVGTIVDGRIRDLQEHRELDYPVWP
jgi:regulator of RNase E activity RraA